MLEKPQRRALQNCRRKDPFFAPDLVGHQNHSATRGAGFFIAIVHRQSARFRRTHRTQRFR